MSSLYEVRRRARHAVLPVACAVVIGYFSYHSIEGDRGLVAWLQLNQEIARTEAELHAIRLERVAIERRVALLEPDGLDRDMLDERARVVLSYARADEVVFLDR